MIRTFFRDSAIYTIPTILSTGISFFLVPLYTRVLSPADYGALDMITVFGSLVALTVALEISQGVARYYREEQTENGRSLLASTALWFTVISFTLFLIVALIMAQELSLLVLGVPDLENVFRLGVINIWFSGLLYLLRNQLRFELRSKAYSMVSIVHSIATATASVLLAYVFHFGIYGLLSGMIIGTIAGSIFGFWYLRTTFKFWFDVPKLKTMLAFSIPLVPSSISVFVSMYIDRLMINHYLSLEAVGLYGIGFRLASISTLVLVGFQTALIPLIYKHYKEPETPHQLEIIFRYFLSFVLMIFSVLTLFADYALRILTTPAYYPARDLVPFLVPAILLSQMYIFAPGIGIAKKTHLYIWINICGACLNTLFNWLLIPSLGYVGAAIATMLGYACVFGAYMLCSQKLYYVPHNWKAIISVVLAAVILVALGLHVHLGLIEDLLVRSFLIIMMLVALMVSGVLKKEELLSGFNLLLKRRNA